MAAVVSSATYGFMVGAAAASPLLPSPCSDPSSEARPALQYLCAGYVLPKVCWR